MWDWKQISNHPMRWRPIGVFGWEITRVAKDTFRVWSFEDQKADDFGTLQQAKVFAQLVEGSRCSESL